MAGMRVALSVFIVGLLTGCAGSRHVALPGSDQALLVSCDSGSQTISDCYNKASGLCHGSYEVLDRSEGYQVTYSTKAYKSAGGGMPKRDILVQCQS
jgi:hypothetical protein